MSGIINFFNPMEWRGMFGLAVKQLRNNKISFIGVALTVFLVVLVSTICANLVASSLIHPVYGWNGGHTKRVNEQLAVWTTFITYISIMAGVILLSGVSFSIKRRWSMFANLRILGMQLSDLRKMICAEMMLTAMFTSLIGLPIGGLLTNSVLDLFHHYNLSPQSFKFELSPWPYLVVFAIVIVLSVIIALFASRKLKNVSIMTKTNPYALGNPIAIAVKTVIGIGLILAPVILMLVYDYKTSIRQGDSIAGLINFALIGPCVGVSLCGRYITYGVGALFSKVFAKAPRISFAFSSLRENASKLNPIFISLIITTLLTMFVTTVNSMQKVYDVSQGKSVSSDDTKSDYATTILITMILIFTIVNIINYVLLFVYDKEQSVKLRSKLGEGKATIFKSLLFETFLVSFFSLGIGLLSPLIYTYEFSHNMLSQTYVIWKPVIFAILLSCGFIIPLMAAGVGYLAAIKKKTVKRRYLKQYA